MGREASEGLADNGPQTLALAAFFAWKDDDEFKKNFFCIDAAPAPAKTIGANGGLTYAGPRVARPPFFDRPLAHGVVGLTGSVAHLDAPTALLTANGPAAPAGPAFCKRKVTFVSKLFFLIHVLDEGSGDSLPGLGRNVAEVWQTYIYRVSIFFVCA